jgi:hypothetical protein
MEPHTKNEKTKRNKCEKEKGLNENWKRKMNTGFCNWWGNVGTENCRWGVDFILHNVAFFMAGIKSCSFSISSPRVDLCLFFSDCGKYVVVLLVGLSVICVVVVVCYLVRASAVVDLLFRLFRGEKDSY